MKSRKFSKLAGLGILVAALSSSGCASSRTYTDLSDSLPVYQLEKKKGKEIVKVEYHQTVDSVLKHYLVPKAYEAVKDIPVVDGPAFSPYAAGVNFWANLLSLISFNGIGLKIIAPKEDLRQGGVGLFMHEVVHMLHYFTIEAEDDNKDEAKFIDIKKFEEAYVKMENDPNYHGIVKEIKEYKGALAWATDLFGMGHMSEELGYTCGIATTNPSRLPKYVRETLTGMYKRTVLKLEKVVDEKVSSND